MYPMHKLLKVARVLVGTSTCAVFAAFAQAPVEWKFFTYFPVNDKPAQLNRAFAEDVTKATGGRLKITVFAAGELPFKAPDVVRIVSTNQVQMGDVALGFVAGDVPDSTCCSCRSCAPPTTSSTRRCRKWRAKPTPNCRRSSA